MMYSREELTQYEYFDRVLDGRRISDVLDPLTGLVSKTHMIAFVQSLIEEKTPFTFGMIDLDNFKYINDMVKAHVNLTSNFRKIFEKNYDNRSN